MAFRTFHKKPRMCDGFTRMVLRRNGFWPRHATKKSVAEAIVAYRKARSEWFRGRSA